MTPVGGLVRVAASLVGSATESDDEQGETTLSRGAGPLGAHRGAQAGGLPVIVDLAWAGWPLRLAEAYALIGLAVAAVFLLWGADRVEPNLRGAWVVRPLLVPGCVLLWPLVLWRWRQLERGAADPCARHRPPRAAQGWMAVALAVTLPVIVFGGLALRQDGPVERPAELLEPPR